MPVNQQSPEHLPQVGWTIKRLLSKSLVWATISCLNHPVWWGHTLWQSWIHSCNAHCSILVRKMPNVTTPVTARPRKFWEFPKRMIDNAVLSRTHQKQVPQQQEWLVSFTSLVVLVLYTYTFPHLSTHLIICLVGSKLRQLVILFCHLTFNLYNCNHYYSL